MQTLLFPNPKLKEISTPITEFNKDLKQFSSDLFAHCHLSRGIGMAAPQVGKMIRLIVVMRSPINQVSFANPRIENAQGSIIHKEGCLSVPGIYARVKRFKSFTLHYQTLEGFSQSLIVTGDEPHFFNIVIQHELDHLDGIEFIDKLDFFESSKISNALNKRRRKQ
jgi:peptide deformylase